jgi:UTP:GlnB (protein PII) uridylyltransferase
MWTEQDSELTRVWFGDDVRDGASQLFVEAPDRTGILFAVGTAVIGARLKILKSEPSIAHGVAHDWFLVAEADGQPVGTARRESIRDQVLAAIRASKLTTAG